MDAQAVSEPMYRPKPNTYTFSAREQARLETYRLAVSAGFYNDGGPVTNWVIRKEFLRGWE